MLSVRELSENPVSGLADKPTWPEFLRTLGFQTPGDTFEMLSGGKYMTTSRGNFIRLDDRKQTIRERRFRMWKKAKSAS